MITIDCPLCAGEATTDEALTLRHVRRLRHRRRDRARIPPSRSRPSPRPARFGDAPLAATGTPCRSMRGWTHPRRPPRSSPAGRRLGARGLISAGEGNLSVRLDAERLADHAERSAQGRARADDLVVVRRGHAEREARSRSGLGPSSDLAIHLAVHAARPDIGAVVHAHLPASMALTLAGEVPDPAALPETALLLPRLPFVAVRRDGQRRPRRAGSPRP